MTPPLHFATGILISKALVFLPIWILLPLCLIFHGLCDFYPEYTGFRLGRKKEKGADVFMILEIIMMFTLLVYVLYNLSWLIVWCLLFSILPDILEEIYQSITKAGWDKPLWFFHTGKWQSNISLKPIQGGVLDLALFVLILMGT
jgi:hypothetical protein